MRAKREHLWIGIVVAAAALGAFLLHLRAEAEDARVRVAFEQQALARVRAVATAQVTLHDRQGRYGGAAELAGAGLLDVAWVESDGAVRSPRYRLDVLLPQGLSPGGFVQLAPEADGVPPGKLAQRHFAVVARPWGQQRTGHRSFYVDEGGEVYVSEGAADLDGGLAPPLPEFHLAQSKQLDSRGRRWWPLHSAQEP